MARSPDARRVKLHRNYSVEEAARCVGAHKNTIRRWIKQGLPTIGGRGQTLILGSALRAFLEAWRKRAKRPCPPGFMYCLKCRAPKPPAERLTQYLPLTPSSGNLKGRCPDCFSTMFRRTKLADVAGFNEALALHADAPVTTPMGHIQRQHLSDAKVVIPPAQVLKAIDPILSPMVEGLWQRRVQSRSLAALRDALLPKLISGELPIRDTERFIGERA